MLNVDPTIVVAAVTGSFGLAGVYLANRKSNRQIREVHSQVKNTHDTNLRDDIDRMLNGLGAVRADIALLREEVTQERRERVELGWQVDRIAAHHRSE